MAAGHRRTAAPQKRCSRVLFVSPTYKPLLEIFGGLMEDDESPLAARHREVRAIPAVEGHRLPHVGEAR
jgi:hypothetical protein